jgi:DNA repair protein RadC
MEEKNNHHIKNWPESERPREKLFHSGSESLSDGELLAILLRTGNTGQSAEDIGRDILSKFGGLTGVDRVHIEDLLAVPGLGIAKVAQIKAAIEIGKRVRIETARPATFETAEKVAEFCRPRFEGKRHEVFLALLLDGQNHLLAERIIAEGVPTQATVYVRRVMEEALRVSASAFVVLHNHPSGNANPSTGDTETTRSLKQAADILSLLFLDHIIIGGQDYYSFAEHDKL